MRVITLDFETFWSSRDYTLSKMGPIEYVRDPRFHAQLLGVRVDRGPVNVYESHEIHEALEALDLEAEDTIIAGHNLHGFDALVLSERFGIRPKYMVDTLALARAAGISRFQSCSHKALCEYLGTGIKTDGTAVSDGKRWPDDFTPAERDMFKKYCADDVLQCSENFFILSRYLTQEELRFESLTARMATEPGIHVDRPLLQRHLVEIDEETEDARRQLMSVFHFDTTEEFLANIRSKPKFCTMLRSLGVEPPMKISEKKTETKRRMLEAAMSTVPDVREKNLYAGMLADPETYTVWEPALAKTNFEFTQMQEHPDERVAQLVTARLENNSSIRRSRVVRFLDVSEGGGSIPVMLQCHKAHTGRYGAGTGEGKSDSLNFQNLGKRNPKLKTIRKALVPAPGYVFVACDSSQVEARMLAYEAGQDDLLDAFRHGRDAYAELAEKMSGIPAKTIHDGNEAGDPECKKYRTAAKTAILSAGYQTGHSKYSHTLLRMGVRLHDDVDRHHTLAKETLYMYRADNPRIVSFWKRCQSVIEHMVAGGEGSFGGPNDDLFKYGFMEVVPGRPPLMSVRLPNGYMLRYPNIRAERNDAGRWEFVYDSWQGRTMMPTRIYGGSLTENVTQAVSFVMLKGQAIGMVTAGVPLICNIHDAWLASVPQARGEATLKIMKFFMSQPPVWAPDFPVACSGETGYNFSIA